MPNIKQILNLLTPLLAIITTKMATAWGIDPTQLNQDAYEWITASIALGMLIYGHFLHATPAKPIGTSLLILLLLPAILLLSGCTSIVNNPQGKTVSITTRVLGVDISATDTTSGTPHVYLGFVSQNITLEPTSTNGPIYSPNFANTFGDTSTSLLDWGINESLASGNYETLASGGTNSAATTIPVLPK
jgi:uncharacterized protein YceK